ncbi:MAG: UDP-N-acetylmuramoyl-L-alanyl-D-glutamate--2,6-diaminopimelate ligase [Acidimicrobiia bacterium]
MVALSELVAELAVGPAAVLHGDGAVELAGATHDSRAVGPGMLFCCVPGARTDGHRFAAAAVEAGAAALLTEHPLGLTAAGHAVPELVVPDVRAVLGLVASAVHGHPSRSLEVIGITGTNGKTTTAAFLDAVLRADGRPTATIGTLTGARTTPEATDLQARLAGLRDGGTRSVVMEVSSHALALHRVVGTRFRLALFLNLGRDHLDFHESEEAYFAAKARLFEPDLADGALVNADDPHGRLLLDAAAVPTVPFSLADVGDLTVGVAGSTGRWRGEALRVPIGGLHNVANAVAALSAAALLGVEEAVAVAGLAACGPVPGRLEPVDAGQPFTVLVDFAHTPDGLEQVLRAARTAPGRVLVVFGAGGDKDRAKRPMMGEVASRLADLAVVTSDNPRSEDPMAIVDDVLAGVRGAGAAAAAGRAEGRVVVEPDRRAAIALALAEARPGDVVVVAGKGHETTQEIGSRLVPFDDREVVRELMR